MEGFAHFLASYWMYILLAVLLVVFATLVVMILRTEKMGAIPRNAGKFRFERADKEISKRAAESLSHAIQLKTITGEMEEIKKLHQYLRERYTAFHRIASCETIAEGSLLYRWKGTDSEKKPVLFCAHMDVVPVKGEWIHPPFSGEIVNDEIWGRGALDCKCVLIGLLEAAERLAAEGFKPARDLYFAFGHD